jgi:hypothetical protein
VNGTEKTHEDPLHRADNHPVVLPFPQATGYVAVAV